MFGTKKWSDKTILYDRVKKVAHLYGRIQPKEDQILRFYIKINEIKVLMDVNPSIMSLL